MNLADCLQNKDAHILTIQGNIGILELRIYVPEEVKANTIAMIGHPHSLFGGSMDNKVVTTIARACSDLGIKSITFNFRGVGKSQGDFDNGVGESADMQHIMTEIAKIAPNVRWILAGFSFGSYVAYRVALNIKPVLLLSIAPPVERCDYNNNPDCPWIIIQGMKDDVVDPWHNINFATNHNPPIEVVEFKDAGHFFHGQLLRLRETISAIVHKRGAI